MASSPYPPAPPRDEVPREMRGSISITCAAGLGALLVGGALRSAGTAHEIRTSASMVAGARPTVLPAVWVFVRPGCAPCTAHLEALDAARHALGPEASARLEGRLQIMGGGARAPHGDGILPDSASTPTIRIVPTTWIWNVEGEVERVWRGARDVRAWTALLKEISAPEAA